MLALLPSAGGSGSERHGYHAVLFERLAKLLE